MPPKHVRYIVSNRCDMSSKRHDADKHVYLGALKYVPDAVFKLLENLTMSWETSRYVEVLWDSIPVGGCTN